MNAEFALYVWLYRKRGWDRESVSQVAKACVDRRDKGILSRSVQATDRVDALAPVLHCEATRLLPLARPLPDFLRAIRGQIVLLVDNGLASKIWQAIDNKIETIRRELHRIFNTT
jgi:hypothetical protein